MSTKHAGLVVALAAVLMTSCGGGDPSASTDKPTVVVTHSILGDVVEHATGSQVEVVTIMGPNADPHDFSASAREVNQIQTADALIVNGGAFEAGLLDVIDAARTDGVPTFEALDSVQPIDFDEPADGAATVDPHFFTDPVRMADAVSGLTDFLSTEVEGIDETALRATSEAYRQRLLDLDAETEAVLAAVPEDDRVLVTNHEVFGYFADRYDFTVLGTVIPGGSTGGAASAAELAELADAIRTAGVAAIFVERSAPTDLAETVAGEVGPVTVVALFSESLGEAGSGGATYIQLMRTNTERIATALGTADP